MDDAKGHEAAVHTAIYCAGDSLALALALALAPDITVSLDHVCA